MTAKVRNGLSCLSFWGSVMEVISITTDTKGNIIDGCNGSDIFNVTLGKLRLALNQKQLVANIFDKNYTVTKLEVKVKNKSFYQFIFEEWKLINDLFPKDISTSSLNTNLKDINTFSDFEQEIIYCLLNGYTVDKNIEQFLAKIKKQEPQGNIRWAISSLYSKFDCDNRIMLIEMLRYYGLDRNLPVTIFPPGVYDL